MSKQQREFYRIHYPQADRPLFAIGKVTYEVLDLSEAGVRFSITKAFRPEIDAVIAGKITFRDSKKTCSISGKVMRINEEEEFCVLQLTERVPLPIMMEEQRLMLKKYPTSANDQ